MQHFPWMHAASFAVALQALTVTVSPLSAAPSPGDPGDPGKPHIIAMDVYQAKTPDDRVTMFYKVGLYANRESCEGAIKGVNKAMAKVFAGQLWAEADVKDVDETLLNNVLNFYSTNVKTGYPDIRLLVYCQQMPGNPA